MDYRPFLLALLLLLFLAWLLSPSVPATISFDQDAYVGTGPKSGSSLIPPGAEANRDVILTYILSTKKNSQGKPFDDEQLKILTSVSLPTGACYKSIQLKLFPDSTSDGGAKSYYIPSGFCGTKSPHTISYLKNGGWTIA